MGFQQALSGLNAASKNLEVIGNNLANSNTYGAKQSRAEFADMYASAMNGGAANTVGIGVSLAAVSQQFTQGNITTTANAMDLAINGAGFFEVSDGKNPALYTRNGQFQVDRDGYIVNNQSLKLLGYAADSTGTIMPGQAVPIQMPTAGIPPSATGTVSGISMQMNLDSRAPVTIPGAGAFSGSIDFNDPSTYNNATAQTVYDAKGQNVALTYYFQKSAADTWNVYVTADGQPISVAAGKPVASSSIVFTPNGSGPSSVTGNSIDLTAFTNAVAAPATWTVPIDVSNSTQYGSPFGVTDMKQDGNAAGQLVGVQIEKNGIVTARYSNGLTQAAGQIEVATFRNPQGLQPMGGNAWSRTYATGDPIVGVPGDGNLGVLQSGALEESNIDMTAELVNMITAQRVYQANAQTIKTEDQVMQTLVNMR